MRLPALPMSFYTPCTTALIDAPTLTRSRQYFAGGIFRGVGRCTGDHDGGIIEACAAHILLIKCIPGYYSFNPRKWPQHAAGPSGPIQHALASVLRLLFRQKSSQGKKSLKIFKAESDPLGERSTALSTTGRKGAAISLSARIRVNQKHPVVTPSRTARLGHRQPNETPGWCSTVDMNAEF